MSQIDAEEAGKTCEQIIDRVSEVFVGSRLLLRKLLAAALANGHVLFEDYPGLGKTLLAKVFTRAIGSETRRVQFTPDVLPADILGTRVWRQNTGEFQLVKGPIFTNVLLARRHRIPQRRAVEIIPRNGSGYLIRSVENPNNYMVLPRFERQPILPGDRPSGNTT